MRRVAAVWIWLVLLLGITDGAHATVSLAWAKVVNVNGTGNALQCTDHSGNTFFGLSTGSTLTVSKFDQYGGQLWSNTNSMFSAFSLANLTTDQIGNVYAAGVINNAPVAEQFAVLLKYGVDGTLLWTFQWNYPKTITTLALQADGNGVRAAYSVIGTLTTLYLDPNGVQTGGFDDLGITPLAARFCLDDNLIITGYDPNSPSTGYCRLYKPDGSTLLNYSVSGTCFADVDEADNLYIAGNTGGLYALYEITKYNAQATQQWLTNATNGQCNALSTANVNQVFLYTSAGQLELLDPDIVPFPATGPPTPVFSDTVSFDSMHADPGGGVVTVKGNVFTRYDLQGAQTWTQTFTVANVASPNVQSFSVPATSAGQNGPNPVYLAGTGLTSGSTYSFFVGKYVANTAVFQLTLSPTYVTGGSPVAGTVKLNAQAGSGGAQVALSSSIPALAYPPSTITIPAGSSSGAFAASTPPVNVAATVTLSATFGGARRSAVVNVIPATLSSVKTTDLILKSGAYGSGTVVLTGRAGSAGRSLALTSSDTTAATVPPGVNVAPYASSVNFVVAAKHVLANTSVTITARSGTVTKTTTLVVTP